MSVYSWTPSVPHCFGFLGSSDSISCHYSPPRDQEWAIIRWVQLLWPPDTKEVNEIMWSHPLSRVFLGLLALFCHNLALGDCSRWGSAHKLEVILLSGCSHSNSWAVPDAWLQLEANLSCSGVCWPGCTPTFPLEQLCWGEEGIPVPFWDFQLPLCSPAEPSEFIHCPNCRWALLKISLSHLSPIFSYRIQILALAVAGC